MTRGEIEILLFRMQAAYPAATVANEGTFQEWATSSIVHMDGQMVLRAFSSWRNRELWPPKIPEMIEESQRVARQEAADRAANELEERAAYRGGDGELFSCGGCLDQRFVPIAGSDPVTGEPDTSQGVQPCRDCMPDVYERWKAGHFLPGHTCGECVAIAQGRRRKVS